MEDVVSRCLDLMDAQRESAFTALEGITDIQLWQRPFPKNRALGKFLTILSVIRLHVPYREGALEIERLVWSFAMESSISNRN